MLLLLLSASCAPAPGLPSETPAVSLSAPTSGMTGRFDADGAVLAVGEEAVRVRPGAWGRGDARTAALRVAPAHRGDDRAERVEFVRPGLTEWWAAADAGFEQGWTVAAAPAGEGDLVLDVAIDGAVAGVGDAVVWLRTAGGARLEVSALMAEDADGARLDAWFAPAPDGFRVVVQDAGARYPIVIDPVYATPSTYLASTGGYSRFGEVIAAAGDVDDDGYADILVAESGYGDTNGRAHVFHGGADGVSTTARTVFDGVTSDYLGYALSGAGDVNGDGYDDVIIGTYGHNAQLGRATVYPGSADGVSTTALSTVDGTGLQRHVGIGVAGAGDVNGDGYDDVLIGDDTGGGRVAVYQGSRSGLSVASLVTLTPPAEPAAESYMGRTVAGAGDLNGDGYADIVLGASYGGSSPGAALVYYGSRSGIGTTPGATLASGAWPDGYATTVGAAGDVNGDGYDDLLVSAASALVGRLYVYAGGPDGVSTTPMTILEGTHEWGSFGYAMGAAGDVDADGYGDVIVGESGADDYKGKAHLFRGSPTGLETTPSQTFSGENTGDYFGLDSTGVGDVNGDGYDDVCIGASAFLEVYGRVYVYEGYRDDDGDGWGGAVDCDDADPDVSPGAAETCNGVDDDCDGTVDGADASDRSEWQADHDGDGYTDPGASTTDCAAPDGYAAATDPDCDDDDATRFPGATDTPGDGVDQDCDGSDSPAAPGGDDDDDDDGAPEGCAGCATPGGVGPAWLLLLAPVLASRRRRP